MYIYIYIFMCIYIERERGTLSIYLYIDSVLHVNVEISGRDSKEPLKRVIWILGTACCWFNRISRALNSVPEVLLTLFYHPPLRDQHLTGSCTEKKALFMNQSVLVWEANSVVFSCDSLRHRHSPVPFFSVLNELFAPTTKTSSDFKHLINSQEKRGLHGREASSGGLAMSQLLHSKL